MTSISVYIGTFAYGSGNSRCAIYDASLNLKGQTDIINPLVLNSWNNFACNIALTAGDYFIVFWSGQNPQWTYDAGAANQFLYKNMGGAPGDFPDPLTSVSYAAWAMSIYATYTPAVAGDGATGQAFARDLTLTLRKPFSQRFPKFIPRALL